MAMPKQIRIEFGDVFPHGAYVVSEVTQVKDFDRSTKDKPVYATDENTGLLVWAVDVMDADPEARKSDRQFTVKVLAKVQPVLPDPLPGLPFRPVEFEGMTATPYIAQQGDFSRLAWSFRATAMKAPKASGPAGSSKAAA